MLPCKQTLKGLQKEGEVDESQISSNSTPKVLAPKILAWIFVMLMVHSYCLQARLDFQGMLKINWTNYSVKWTLGRTHKQPRLMFPSIAGNMSVCLRGGGLWARLKLNTVLWSTLAQSKQCICGSTEGNTAGQKQVWKSKLIENRHLWSEQQGGGDGWERGLKVRSCDHLKGAAQKKKAESSLPWCGGKYALCYDILRGEFWCGSGLKPRETACFGCHSASRLGYPLWFVANRTCTCFHVYLIYKKRNLLNFHQRSSILIH